MIWRFFLIVWPSQPPTGASIGNGLSRLRRRRALPHRIKGCFTVKIEVRRNMV
jgi:hypothetical protein